MYKINKNIIFFLITCICIYISCINCELSNDLKNLNWRQIKQSNLENLRIRILAFGDFNSDKYVDLIGLNDYSAKQAVEIHIWNIHSQHFEISEAVYIEDTVHSVIPVDINFDGRLDLIVIIGNIKKATLLSEKQIKYFVKIYIQSEEHKLIFKWETDEDFVSDVQPFLCDINNDGKPDLVAHRFNNTKKGNSSERFVLLNKSNYNQTLFEFHFWKNLSKYIHNAEETDILKLSHPHSSAFVDIDGDCKSDIIFVINILYRYII